MHLCRHILVAGTRPPPYSWEKWNLKLLEPSNIRELQDDRTQSLKGKLGRVLLGSTVSGSMGWLSFFVFYWEKTSFGWFG